MNKIEEAARMWNKTKDPQYKYLWYKLIKEFANVQNINNTKCRDASAGSLFCIHRWLATYIRQRHGI